MKALVFNS